MIERNGREARNGVHGRAEIMGHVREEGGFRLAGVLGQLERVLQHQLLAQLLAHLAGHVARGQDHLGTGARQMNHPQLHVLLVIAEQAPIAHGEVGLAVFETMPQRIGADLGAHPRTIFGHHERIDVVVHDRRVVALLPAGEGEFFGNPVAAPINFQLVSL